MTKPFDPSKPVQTRDGRKARILCTDKVGHHPIVALVMSSYSSEENTFYYDEEGCISEVPNPLDLVNIPERRVEFRVLYPGGRNPYLGQLKFLSVQAAVNSLGRRALERYVAVLEFLYEDDEIVDVKLHPREK